MTNTFIQTTLLLLREGLEALLVLAALAAYLTKAGAQDRLGALYGGAGLAVLASAVGAWLFAVLNSGAHSDLLEGIVLLTASGLMLYVSGWLLVRQDPRAWQSYLSKKADDALARQTIWAVAALAFLAVFREGAETILFINALASTSGGWGGSLFAGIAAAAVGLAILFYFINAVARKLPLRPLFILTSAFLFVMAVKFIGDAVSEFQQQALLPFDEIAGISWLSAAGLNATVEAVSIQTLIIASAAATYLFMRRQARLANRS